VRLGIAHHFGWAVAITASADHKVVGRRRIELIEPGMPTAPIHHEGKPLDDDATAVLVAQVSPHTAWTDGCAAADTQSLACLERRVVAGTGATSTRRTKSTSSDVTLGLRRRDRAALDVCLCHRRVGCLLPGLDFRRDRDACLMTVGQHLRHASTNRY
jgi:hypothetical protein